MRTIRKIAPGIVGILLFVAGIYLIKTTDDPAEAMRALPYLFVGLGGGLFGHSAGELLNLLILRNHPEQVRSMEIERKDERNIMLAARAKAKAYDMMLFIFAAMLIALALMGVALEAVLMLVVAYLFVHGYMIYYRLKLEKEA